MMSTPESTQAEDGRHRELVEGAALAAELARAAGDLKAEDVRVLDVRGLTDVMDFIVLATVTGVRHLRAMCDAAAGAVRGAGRTVIGEGGDADTGWTVVDTGDVVCHLMTRTLRAYYDLDGLWADAPVVDAAPAAPLEAQDGGARG